MTRHFPPRAFTPALSLRLLLAGLTLLPLIPLTGAGRVLADSITMNVGGYSLALPAEGITGQTLENGSLATHYSDQSSVTLRIVHQADFEERTAIPAAEYLKSLFGEGEPSNSILQVLRDRATRDLQSRQVESQGRLTYYLLTFPDHAVVHISDDYQPEYYVSIEARNRPLGPLLDSLKGGRIPGQEPAQETESQR